MIFFLDDNLATMTPEQKAIKDYIRNEPEPFVAPRYVKSKQVGLRRKAIHQCDDPYCSLRQVAGTDGKGNAITAAAASCGGPVAMELVS